MADARLLDVEVATPGGEGEGDSPVSRDELTAVLLAWPCFGCFSIFLLHPVRCLHDVYVKLFPLAVLTAQLLIPIALMYRFVMRFEQLEGPKGFKDFFCPRHALIQERLLAVAIALIYSFRSSMNFRGRRIEADPDAKAGIGHGLCAPQEADANALPAAKAAELRLRDRSGVLHSPLNDYGQVDEFMAISYEGLVYVLNLWLTLHSPDGVHSSTGGLNQTSDALIDVIGASLALQFAIDLTEEFKARYFDYYGDAVERVWSERLHTQHSSLMLSCHVVDGRGRLQDVPWSQLRFGSVGQRLRFGLFLIWYVPEILVTRLVSRTVPYFCFVCIFYLPTCI